MSGASANLSLNIIGAQYFDWDAPAPAYRYDFDTVQTTGVFIPEPATLVLLLFGGLALLRARRRT